MISLYIYKKILENISKKNNPSYKKIYDEQMQLMKEKNIKLPEKKPWQIWKTIDTKYGTLNLYRHGKIEDKVVIFVHGILVNSRIAIKVFDYYFSRGFQVITYDNLGWGENNKYRCSYGQKEGRLLKEVISFVKKNFKKVNVVHGESMGGATVYSYLGKYVNSDIDKFIIDSGYNSFLTNVLIKGNEKVPFLPYIEAPMLALLLFFTGIKVRKFVSKKKLQKMENVFHFHGLNDEMVDYNMMKKYSQIIHFKTFNNIRHVKAYFDAREDLYNFLDKVLEN